MELLDSIANSFKGLCRGFDQQQPFGGSLQLSLPAVERLDLGHDIDAGGQAQLDEFLRDLARLFGRTCSGKNNAGAGLFHWHLRVAVYQLKEASNDAEGVARRNKPPGQQIRDLFGEVGSFIRKRTTSA